MEPKHHSKIMVIIGVLIVTLIIIIFVGLLVGRKKTTGPLPDTSDPTQMMIDAATASKTSSILDPEVQELNKSSTAPKKSSNTASDREAREALNRASSAQ